MDQHDRKLPDDPIGFIQRCIRAKKVYWTYHVNMRLRERFIPRKWVLDSVDSYEIIESYPEDKYLPSYLVWARNYDVIFHVLFAADVEANNVRVITLYRPTVGEWSEDKKRRNKS